MMKQRLQDQFQELVFVLKKDKYLGLCYTQKQLNSNFIEKQYIFFYQQFQFLFFDAITWIIPPAMPIFFAICQSMALVRLGYSHIIAVDPSQTVVASEIKLMCFDKTGTLTKNNMDVIGFCDFNIGELITKLPNQIKEEKQKALLYAFGTCHGVYLVEGEHLGDELDVKMVEFSGFKIRKSSTCKLEAFNDNLLLKVIKQWEFESQFQRMGCLVQDQNGKNYAFVKGSPELVITGNMLIDIQQISNQKLLKDILQNTFVFARCKPEQKTEIIYMHQTLFKQKIGMIGDGANDCSAIKQADLGVSFCEADASFSAPFSYQKKSINCLPIILAEGRCVLTNMIECYRLLCYCQCFQICSIYYITL
ncbi:hypothetical protein IMG5_111710 [Ichthyophthirius multifiliis]|uniref:Uncharacterized protein n=1 Tax=Ichthyophthirius multifiliis TaxID=5932 RepID=G0QTU1_ICHMU|nr:hypothetical protein IMG5_111710 [Ichthyophthirius multifiliis]EGR31366.1 hypothetical protein IMG5_111710 [Ichthyophthirius multifiliis]|eukprot:XP_004034852.1 hypothetical protein IMG5_111710 [Ichthyophthirius multifiliis]